MTETLLAFRTATQHLQEKSLELHRVRVLRLQAQRNVALKRAELVRSGAITGKNETERNAQFAELLEDAEETVFELDCEAMQLAGEYEVAQLEHLYCKMALELQQA
jgi:hypothetical protein